jgi:hypothetical protein
MRHSTVNYDYHVVARSVRRDVAIPWRTRRLLRGAEASLATFAQARKCRCDMWVKVKHCGRDAATTLVDEVKAVISDRD